MGKIEFCQGKSYYIAKSGKKGTHAPPLKKLHPPSMTQNDRKMTGKNELGH
jgi:hypothetical protein